jgi:hypothetical protein
MIIKNHNGSIERSILDQVILRADWITKAVKGDTGTCDTDFANHFSVYGLDFFFFFYCDGWFDWWFDDRRLN